MNKTESDLLRLDEKWRHDRLSRELAGRQDDTDDSDEQPSQPEPLSKRELRDMLRRDRGAKGGK